MAIKRAQKEQILTDLVSVFKEAKGVVFADYRTLNVPEIEDLRSKLREKNAFMKVAKLTLMDRALKEAGVEVNLDFAAPTAVIYSTEDEVTPAKVAVKFAKDTKKLDILMGLLDQKVMDKTAVDSLAQLPGKEELVSHIVGVLQSPLRNISGSLTGVSGNLLSAVKTIASKS